jgi:hypothetical protein
MATKLKPKDKKFVKEYIENGNNATQAIKEVYDIKDENYAGVKGHRMLRSDKIQQAIQSIAEQIPDEDLVKVHKEGLNASRTIKNEGEDIVEPDYAVRHKYLDSAYKIKGIYAPDKSLNIDLKLESGLTTEEKEALLNLLK